MNPLDQIQAYLQVFWWLLAIIGAVIGLGVALIFSLRRALRRRAYMHGGDDAMVTLRITIPKYKKDEDTRQAENASGLKEKIAVAETLFSAIGGLKPEHGLHAFLRGRTDVFAFEIVAHEKLVTFYIAVPGKHQEFLEQQLHAQWSDAAIEPVEDYNMFSPTGTIVAGYLQFTKEQVLPLRTYKDLDSDPLNALTNALAKVGETDGVAIQYIIRPLHKHWRAMGTKIVRNMQQGMSFNEAKSGKQGHSWFATKEQIEDEKQKRRERKLSSAETKMLEGIENKINKAGVEVTVRIVSSAATTEQAQVYLTNVLQAFNQYNIYEYGNALQKHIPRSRKAILEGFIFRQFAPNHRIIVNTEELASLWHMPLPTSEAPNIRWMNAKTAPVPVNMPTSGLLMGYNIYRGKKTDVYMKEADRRRHVYMIGKTGSGKSEVIKNLVLQDIRAGKGVGVIDPHGDLTEDLMGLIPKERLDDVVYFNPADIDRPMGLNMLEADTEKGRDDAVQEMISIFMMLFPPEMIGPMFEHSMRNYMLTLMADLKNVGTLIEIPRLVADPAFQKQWTSKVTDPIVRSFWEDEMAKTTDYHKSEMMGYLISKIGRFAENSMMRNIIGQRKSAFNFRQIMDEGKILLVNLSKGQTGEVNASLLGLILVSKLQMAAFGRSNLPESERKDFYLYVDEFQNFVTPSIATILSEARKYRLNLIMAHQYMGQLVRDGKSEIRDAVLGNVGTIMVARVGPEDVETLGKVFDPVFSGQDLMNTDMYTWTVKMIIDNAQVKPFTMKAYPPTKGNYKVAEALKEVCRLQYGVDRKIVEQEIIDRSGLAARNKVPPKPLPVPPSL